MIPALVVYALAALTAAGYQSALAEARGRARAGIVVIVLAAALWPTAPIIAAVEWIAARRTP